ncbi:MAG: RcnB family protein [Sphingomonadales bacterium]|nr:RcnB family protein [Sphingomonadales bacterium]
MRNFMLAALAATMLVPVAAQAQSAQEVRHDRQEVRRDQREVRGDVRRGDWREAREDRRELREDRREAREDWRDYRNHHRDAFRMRPYVGPSRGWTYRPVTIGYQFAPTFYSQRYWIANPGLYRLPPAGPGLRWVRYGNDVVLVNVRTGRVMQVYTQFFW